MDPCFGKYGFSACHYPNGLCTAKDTCRCRAGWCGPDCNIPVCFGLANEFACNFPHGHCISPNKCKCEANYYGYNCKYPRRHHDHHIGIPKPQP